ncbi:hypothetical protein LOAG_15452 [Loa loa]|uniref:Uncharacterized protein n=1 Tax=Loa loa TaxID=7209 RepID=A0A1S0TFT5_LOALO|nr:hypothetical protein LOAG_15452 [Loa loa]EFO13078.1 hypothetical protein LOAG_15452 [Loa loa]
MKVNEKGQIDEIIEMGQKVIVDCGGGDDGDGGGGGSGSCGDGGCGGGLVNCATKTGQLINEASSSNLNAFPSSPPLRLLYRNDKFDATMINFSTIKFPCSLQKYKSFVFIPHMKSVLLLSTVIVNHHC